MAKAFLTQIDLPQAVEKQQPSPHDVVFKILGDKLQWRQCGHFQKSAAEGRAAQALLPDVRRERRAARFGNENLPDDGLKLIAPAAKGFGVTARKLGERVAGFFKLGPPLERAAVIQDQRDVEWRLDVAGAVALQLQVAIPGHRGECAMKKRVYVVIKARQARVFDRRQSAAGDVGAVEREELQPGAAQIRLQH
jgi:hypothetical protein